MARRSGSRNSKAQIPAGTTISLLNMKGGVGKTTLAVNLAWHLCRRSRRKVLLIDLDPQFNASQYLMDYGKYSDHCRNKGTIADILIQPTKPILTVKKSAAFAPSVAPYLYRVETNVFGGHFDILPSELTLSKAVKNPHSVAFRLEKALESVREAYDYVFIDCAPTDSILTDTALMASDYVLVPVKPDRFSVLGYGQIRECLEEFRISSPDPHRVQDLGVVFTRVTSASTIEGECIREVRLQAEHVFKTKVKDSKSYLRSVHEQTPVFDTRYTHLLTKIQITALVQEIEERILALTASGDEV